MADYRKSFNFRNGVQVDNDNFLVNSTGLVGIGTTVPTEALDVRGNVKVVGLATIQDAFIAIGTALDFRVGITSIHAGLITATTSSGIVTYYGDGRYLQGLPTSQWVDIDAGLGYTSIYAAGNVGVATNDPRYTFQVGGNTNVSDFSSGVGINSTGDINATGIITAATFYGYGIGVTGLNAATAIAAGTLDNARLPSTITVSNVVANTLTGIATTARDLVSTATIDIARVQAGIVTAGISTIHSRLTLDSAELAVGNSGNKDPRADIQVRNSGIASISVVSDSNEARVLLGKTIPGVGSSYGFIQFGNTDGSYTASSIKSLDIINNDTGSINQYLHYGSAGIDTGRWGWIYGQTLAERMSLTWDGNLGIGITNPSRTLEVVGTSTVTGNAWVGGDFSVLGSFTPTSITVQNNGTVKGRLGVGTDTAPSAPNDLQVGQNPTGSNKGVSVSANGDVKASGIITATNLVTTTGFSVSAGATVSAQGGLDNGSNIFQFSIVGGRLNVQVPGVGGTSFVLA